MCNANFILINTTFLKYKKFFVSMAILNKSDIPQTRNVLP